MLIAVTVASATTVVVPAQVASAATATVIPVACGVVYGPGGLVEAINTANANTVSPSVINLDPACPYDLTQSLHDESFDFCNPPLGGQGLPPVTRRLTINGSGATIARVADAPNFGIFRVRRRGNLTLNQLTVAGGTTQVSGGIYNGGGHLTLDSVTVRNNTSTCGTGGGIFNDGGRTLIRNSHIVDNTATVTAPRPGDFARGGGIANSGGTLTVRGSVIDNNTAMIGDHISSGGAWGGGLWNDGNATIANSTVDNNRAVDPTAEFSEAKGGGIYTSGDSVTRLTLNHTEVADNATVTTGMSLGGGILVRGATTIENLSTVTRNSAGDGGGIYSETIGSTIQVVLTTGSTVTDNQPNNCAPPDLLPGCVG